MNEYFCVCHCTRDNKNVYDGVSVIMENTKPFNHVKSDALYHYRYIYFNNYDEVLKYLDNIECIADYNMLS